MSYKDFPKSVRLNKVIFDITKFVCALLAGLVFEIFLIVIVPFQYGNGFHMWCMWEQVKWKDCNRMVLMLEIVEILTKRGRGA